MSSLLDTWGQRAGGTLGEAGNYQEEIQQYWGHYMNCIPVLEAALQKDDGKMEAAVRTGASWVITRTGRAEGSGGLVDLRAFYPYRREPRSFHANLKTLL